MAAIFQENVSKIASNNASIFDLAIVGQPIFSSELLKNQTSLRVSSQGSGIRNAMAVTWLNLPADDGGSTAYFALFMHSRISFCVISYLFRKLA